MEAVYLALIYGGIQVIRLWWVWTILAGFSLAWRWFPTMIMITRFLDVVAWLWVVWVILAIAGIIALGLQFRQRIL